MLITFIMNIFIVKSITEQLLLVVFFISSQMKAYV